MKLYKIITFSIIIICLVVIASSLKKIFFNNSLTTAQENLVKIHKDLYSAKQVSIYAEGTASSRPVKFEIYLDNEANDYSYKVFEGDKITEGYIKKGEESYNSFTGEKWTKQNSTIGGVMMPILKSIIATNLLESITMNDEKHKVSGNPLKGTTEIKSNDFFKNVINSLSQYQNPQSATMNEDTIISIIQDFRGRLQEVKIETYIQDTLASGADAQLTITVKDVNMKKDIELPKPEDIEVSQPNPIINAQPGLEVPAN